MNGQHNGDGISKGKPPAVLPVVLKPGGGNSRRRRYAMGDKGKKDKDKARKQKIKKQAQMVKSNLEKLPIQKP